MKKIGILGSTGSIGNNALKVIESHPEEFELLYITGNRNIEELARQIMKYNPKYAAIARAEFFPKLCNLTAGTKTKLMIGLSGILNLAANKEADIALNAIVGSSGLQPTIAAINAGIDIALSNKESLVMAGDLVNTLLKKKKTALYPVDSEHSAIWQCLQGEKQEDLDSLILTGSGGPFLHRERDTFDQITLKEALKHPNWAMGAKITIDSATLMNKGLEVIEAYHLFQIPAEKIELLIHPQSIIHSLVRFRDGSVKAQLGLPDMKIPIQYALSYPRHIKADWERLDLAKLGQLSFFQPDFEKFPALKLAYEALKIGGTAPAILNVANEQSVYAFMKEEIRFKQIWEWTDEALQKFPVIQNPDLEEILATEKQITDYITMKRKEIQ
ncbi:MAG TPA: 1-deoxy-D-xylulose-5-phosphate reductoisomerase [Candidatus Marinimicrobia bacterium]|nr:1-deoxy-D-xylulose-5-phosphate reductoisomerase [Candidatus Neomarinimicrobiota bacterium]